MNELKQYAQKRIKEFSLHRPITCEDSFWGQIKEPKDIDAQFKYAENFIASCEQEGNAVSLQDYEEQDLKANIESKQKKQKMYLMR